jgi:hypothetical protein
MLPRDREELVLVVVAGEAHRCRCIAFCRSMIAARRHRIATRLSV